MPNFDYEISNKTVGDAFDVVRTVGAIPAGLSVDDAYMTVWANGSVTPSLFQKHITTSPDADEGLIDGETDYNVTADGVQIAGATSLTILPLPTTIREGVVLEFAGGAIATLATKAFQGATVLQVSEIDSPIANAEVAVYTTVRLRFKIKKEDSVLIVPSLAHPYDIQITLSNGDPFTFEDGTITLRPQRTIGV